MKQTHLPPGCGADLDKPLLYNPYQQTFMEKRRLRFCLNCKTIGSMDENARFTCKKCGMHHVSNLTAPRVYDQFLILAGRGGGKTLIGAHAVREELLVPNGIVWVMGPTYKILHDSTFPTLIRLIPPSWVKKWDADNTELLLTNNTLLAFRSLEDPERARGPHGVTCGWFDEAAQAPERGYDVFKPTLLAANGIVIATTTVLGMDWTYERLEKPALIEHEAGYWATRYWTMENPLFKTNPQAMATIERDRKRMSPEFFAQEYKAERRNAQGLVYNWQELETAFLGTDDEVRKYIPEWPNINSGRKILIGLDSGADHPFGAVEIVVTERGLVVVQGYLKRMQAISVHADAIKSLFQAGTSERYTWAANKNEANLRLEFGLKGIGVAPVESKHEVGIQRVASWLHTGQLVFAYTAKEAHEQMKGYRYADNTKQSTGEKKKENVFKLKDEYPDAIRYAVMAWPHLPVVDGPLMTESQKKRWDAMDERTQLDLERVREFNKRKDESEMQEKEDGYPMGEFFNPFDDQWGGF
jgi:hypothetical protein